MNSNIGDVFSSRWLMSAAVVGLVGAAGVYIYEQVYAEKRRSMLVKEVARLDKQLMSMRTELEVLRELQKETELRRQKHKKNTARREAKRRAVPSGDTVDAPHVVHSSHLLHSAQPDAAYTSDSEYYTDYQSVIGTDGEMDSEEFYDVHTDEEGDTLRESSEHDSTKELDEDLSDNADSLKSSPVHNNVKK